MPRRPTPLCLLLPLGLLACQDPIKDTASVESFDGDIGGVVFKGPMTAGSAVTLQPIAPDGSDLGEPVETTISDDGGSYSAHVAHEGLVRVLAEGPAFDEAQGARGEATVTLMAYAEVGDGDQQIQVNVLTDLGHARVEALLAAGLTPGEAIPQAQEELGASLPIGVRGPPATPGEQLDPFSADEAASILFAQSSVLAQAGKDLEVRGEGSLPDLMDSIRADLADDGALSDELKAVIHGAEPNLNPDLATLSLTALIEDAGLGWTVPDLQPGLDSDQDGLANSEDNCRYVANADQADEGGKGFGDACDYRLSSISTSLHWGCGVLALDGAVACWEEDGVPTGGTPPRPDVYPAHDGYPWRAGDYLSGAYTLVASGDNLVCAAGPGGLACWYDGASAELAVAGDYTTLRAGGGMICALDADGEALCVRNTGDLLYGDAGPWTDVSPFGDGGAIGVRADGTLDWVSTEAYSGTPPELPEGTFRRVAATASGWGCALAEADGSLSCFGGTPMATSPDVPTGTFSELAIGSGIGCVSDADGDLSWWKDDTSCPDVDGAPSQLWNLSAAGCQICGTDADGLGQCWPRYWDSERARAE